MNIQNIIEQIVRMKGLVLEVNRTTIAERFRNLITNSMKNLYGDDDEKTLNWVNNDADKFMDACQLIAPRAPVEVTAVAPGSVLAQLIDRWEAVDTWRTDEADDWKPMLQETLNVKATMLRELREILNARHTTPGPQPPIQQV